VKEGRGEAIARRGSQERYAEKDISATGQGHHESTGKKTGGGDKRLNDEGLKDSPDTPPTLK